MPHPAFTSSTFLARRHALPAIAAAAGLSLVLHDWWSAKPLWLDEQMVLLNLKSRGITELWGELWLDQSAPLGWLLVEDTMLRLFGEGERWLRLFPTLFGVAAIAAAAIVGVRWLSPIGATVFALLCAFGQWLSFYAVEIKPYSADVFWGVVLPALTVWVADGGTTAVLKSRLRLWGIVVVFAHWFSFGALFVTAACMVLLGAALLRGHRRESYPMLLAVYLAWLLSFAAHYALTIGKTHGDPGLQGYWQFAFPSASAGFSELTAWIGRQFKPFAEKPGGTLLWQIFWATAAIGWATAKPRLLGGVAAATVAAGFALAVFRILPLYERLSLWLVPSLYFGIALFVDTALRVLRSSTKHHWIRLSIAGIAAMFVLQLTSEMTTARISHFRPAEPARTNRDTDDRTAIRWIMQQLRPGDVIASSHYGLPAIWWYGGGTVDDAVKGAHLPDGTRLYQIEQRPGFDHCGNRRVGNVLGGDGRVFLYLGFPDTLPGVADFLLEDLARYAPITEIKHFAGISRVAVADPRASSGLEPKWKEPYWQEHGTEQTIVKGCAAYMTAPRW